MTALLARLRSIDSKVIASVIGGIVAALATRYGVDPSDPIVVGLVTILVAAIAGVATPNAASGLQDRWSGPAASLAEDAEDVSDDDLGLSDDVRAVALHGAGEDALASFVLEAHGSGRLE